MKMGKVFEQQMNAHTQKHGMGEGENTNNHCSSMGVNGEGEKLGDG